jgi:hypothetical protein
LYYHCVAFPRIKNKKKWGGKKWKELGIDVGSFTK